VGGDEGGEGGRALGLRVLSPPDAVQGVPVPVRVLYPTHAAPTAHAFGPYALTAAHDAPIAGERLHVVAMSHGSGGTPWGFLGLAEHLVRGGCAVVLVEHPGDSRTDGSLSGTPATLANRPRHVRLALDALAADAALAPHVALDRIAVLGHSIGGYTALALAGGKPIALPNETPDRVARPVAVDPDPRVAAAILLAPALPWFLAPGALASVRVPLLVRVGERDDLSPPYFVERILAALPAGASLDLRVIPGAGHFLCFWPIPEPIARARLLPAQDPPGFDRAACQPELRRDVLAFVQSTL
jgi:predicted dienelactone hydrolase